MWLTCVLIVASETPRRSAIWPLVRPAAINSRTCPSRAVKPSGSSRVDVCGGRAAARRRSCARGSRIVWPGLAARRAGMEDRLAGAGGTQRERDLVAPGVLGQEAARAGVERVEDRGVVGVRGE